MSKKRVEILTTARLGSIKEIAATLHHKFGTWGEAFPITEFIEHGVQELIPNFRWEIVENINQYGKTEKLHQCSDLAGFLKKHNDEFWMLIPNRIYQGAITGDNFSRSTMAHELGHLFLHPNKLENGRARPIQAKKKDLIEKEADLFASGLLLPNRAICNTRSDLELSRKYKVSRTCVELCRREKKLLQSVNWRCKNV